MALLKISLVIGLLVQSSWAAQLVANRLLSISSETNSHKGAAAACVDEKKTLLKVDTEEIHEWSSSQGVHWVDGNAQFSINWDNKKGKIGGYSAKHLPEKNGNFCVSANDIKGRLRVKDCDIQQKYACEANLDGFDTKSVPGRALKYFEEQLPWNDAVKACNNLHFPGGGHLLTVDSTAVNDWVLRQPHSIWIGLSDQESEGEWKWESGKPLEKDFWHPGEPNNVDGEDCAKANAWSETQNWNDQSCESSNYYACEIWLE